jgi:hypothetical protein
MPSLRTSAAATMAGLCAVLLVAGCTKPNPTAPTSASPTSTASPTVTPVGAPKSRDQAWTDATRTVARFVEVQYEIQADTGANPDRIALYATGSAFKNVKEVAAGLADKHITTTGEPKWTPSASASTFGDLTPAGGSTIPNGIVYVRGCFDVSRQVPKYANGSPAPVSNQRIYPVQFTVRYLPNNKAWKVGALASIAGEPGAPTC